MSNQKPVDLSAALARLRSALKGMLVQGECSNDVAAVVAAAERYRLLEERLTIVYSGDLVCHALAWA